MTATTVARNDLTDLPLYATKPQRRIPGTNAVAVTMYRSADGTVRHYAVFTADGTGYLGHAHYQPRTRVRSAGYTLNASPALSEQRWPNLTAFAIEMAARHGIDGIAR